MPILFIFFSLFVTHAFAAEGLSCLGTPRVYELEHTSDMLFVKAALPEEAKRNALFNFGIIYQNLFPYAEMAKLQRPTPTIRWGGYDLANSKVEILKVEDASYPFSAELTSEPPKLYAPVVNTYLAALAKIRSFKVGGR